VVAAAAPAGGAVGSLVLGASAVSVLVGAGMAAAVGVSVLVPVVPLVAAALFFLLKRDLILSTKLEGVLLMIAVEGVASGWK